MIKTKHLIFLISLILPQVIWANVSLNKLFTSGMVVQQETEIPVWGWADPKEKISIETSWGAKSFDISPLEGKT